MVGPALDYERLETWRYLETSDFEIKCNKAKGFPYDVRYLPIKMTSVSNLLSTYPEVLTGGFLAGDTGPRKVRVCE